MKRWFHLGSRYYDKMTTAEKGLLKVSLCSVAVIVGLNLPKQQRRDLSLLTGMFCLLSGFPIMLDFIKSVTAGKR